MAFFKRSKFSFHVLTSLILIVLMLLASCQTDGSGSAVSTIAGSYEAEYLADYDAPRQKWGFIDTGGAVRIRPRYDQVSQFTEEVAAANFGGRWGYINQQGDEVIPFEYLAAWPFVEGLARVMTFEGKACFVNKRGKLTCPADANEMSDFSEGVSIISTSGGQGAIRGSGQIVLDPVYDVLGTCQNGEMTFIQGDKYGVVDTSGQVLIEARYDRLWPRSDGRYLVRSGVDHFFLDTNGERTSANSYISARPYVDNVAAVRSSAGWELVDLEERPITSASYVMLMDANETLWIAQNNQGQFGLIDSDGNALTSFAYDQINKIYDGMATFMRGGYCGFMNTSGDELLPPQYGLAWDFHEGLARAAFRDGIAFIDKTGRVPFIPRYYEMRDFSEGLAAFQEN